ncbi:hypothetical protein [Phycicoccus avicenniae]|uniref:hypothetical protein n=1 Tax=Phycicoccus avicenniae TaxID=2828860 RepID=UPI003D26CC96
MAKKGPRAKTFAELAGEPTWSETAAVRTGQHAVRLGGTNVAGEFFDPSGNRLALEAADVSTDAAQEALDAGALVVAESCGCGGDFGGCTPVWLSNQQLRSLRGGPPPVFTGSHRAPTWLELWGNTEGRVIYAHGDVSWGGMALG